MVFVGILFGLMICVIGFYCKMFFEKDNIKTFILKIIASSLFLTIGIYSATKNPHFDYTQTIILGGLIFCVVGDVVIGLRRLIPKRKDLYIMLGMAFFLLAHFMYSTSFLINYSENIIFAFGLIIVLWIGFVLLLKYTKIEFGKFLIPSYVYILSASIMFSVSLLSLINHFGVSSINLFVGIVLFIISDVFLCYTYYKKELQRPKLIKCISVITYFTGQALIALSIFLF